ncbi:hypothetical protein K474DRAFT_1667259 [Panus rudis PR-1116 ss-1]|nr:hypothetical protein K474DRAFT_1667259 [Panus rudis PR-1116 ss-1]
MWRHATARPEGGAEIVRTVSAIDVEGRRRGLLACSSISKVFSRLSVLGVQVGIRHLGLSDECARLTRMILTILPAPPPPVRPSISVDGGVTRSEDDSTYKLGDIIKASANVRRCEQGREDVPVHVITKFEHRAAPAG